MDRCCQKHHLTYLDKWDKTAHPMKKNQYGVFEITIPPTPDGKPVIPHNSMIKVRTPTW